jgi:hypothetical protein
VGNHSKITKFILDLTPKIGLIFFNFDRKSNADKGKIRRIPAARSLRMLDFATVNFKKKFAKTLDFF